jgi:hypothetical protein
VPRTAIAPAGQRTRRRRQPIAGWLVVVARDEGARHAKLRRVLAGDGRLRVIFDRRVDGLRNPGWVNHSLQTLGFAVVRLSDNTRRDGSDSRPPA